MKLERLSAIAELVSSIAIVIIGVLDEQTWQSVHIGVFDPRFSRSVDEYLAGVPALPGVYINGFEDQQ
jgi:hypothetical protein